MNDDELAQAIALTTEQIMAAKDDLEIGERLITLYRLVCDVVDRPLLWPVTQGAIGVKFAIETAVHAIISEPGVSQSSIDKTADAIGLSMGLAQVMQQHLGQSGDEPKQ